ncbi:MAG: histidine kinase [Kineosporiaceae bacterium]
MSVVRRVLRGPLGPVALAAVQLGGTLLLCRFVAVRPGPDLLSAILLFAGPLALLLAGRPMFGGVVAVASAAAYLVMGYPFPLVALAAAVALWRLVAAGRLSEAVLVAASGWASAVLMSGVDTRRLGGQAVVGVAALALLTTAEAVRARREAGEVWREARTDQRARQSGEVRLRLARDLHESVTDHLSLIETRSGMALHLLDGGAAGAAGEARAALVAARESSLRAGDELREALSLLLDDRSRSAARPAGLDGLPALVQQWDAVGLLVTVTGRPGRLPSAVDQAAYRVVQEALTNVSRHSAATRADVQLSRDGEQFIVTVSDPGPARRHGIRRRAGADLTAMWDAPEPRPGASGTLLPPSAAGTGTTPGPTQVGGQGLTGIRERVAGLGGAVVAGPPKVPSVASWIVRAVFPVAPPGSDRIPPASDPVPVGRGDYGNVALDPVGVGVTAGDDGYRDGEYDGEYGDEYGNDRDRDGYGDGEHRNGYHGEYDGDGYDDEYDDDGDDDGDAEGPGAGRGGERGTGDFGVAYVQQALLTRATRPVRGRRPAAQRAGEGSEADARADGPEGGWDNGDGSGGGPDGDEAAWDGSEDVWDGDEAVWDGDEAVWDGDEAVWDGDEDAWDGDEDAARYVDVADGEPGAGPEQSGDGRPGPGQDALELDLFGLTPRH